MAIEILSGAEFPLGELVRFADRIFGQGVQPGGFSSLLPKLYAQDCNSAEQHLVLREDGEIRALLLCAIQTVFIAGQKHLMAQIGTVSVDPDSRGKGYMGRMLEKSREKIEDHGCEMSTLGGQRQRYGYFGYEPAGIEVRASVTPANLRHVFKNKSEDYSFVPLSSDSPYIEQSRCLYQAQGIALDRPKINFSEILHSWRSKPYALLNQNQFVGYLSVTPGDLPQVHELLLNDSENPTDIFGVIGEHFGCGKSVEYYAPAYDVSKLNSLCDISESYSIMPSHQFLALRFSSLIKSLLTLKSRYTLLQDGEMNFAIEGETFCICVENQKVSVTSITKKSRITTLSRSEATRIFFSPRGFLPLNTKDDRFVPGWFPVPLYIPFLDLC